MKHLFVIVLLLSTLAVQAQQFTIRGKIVSEDGAALPSATLFVEEIADSTLVAYTISDEEGEFLIEGSTSLDSLRLVSNYTGFFPLVRTISLEGKEIDLGVLKMEFATNELGEVTVVASRAPVRIKSDTLEFNAGSFNTRQNANLEDVLKKLPGVEVDAQGNITVNGKPVSRILVNGEEFFGTDPKIATKNLPKEIIDKIQVVNTKTKTEEFTGKAGNPDDKTINITLEKDKDRGYFARATAGGGTDERYELSGIMNYFQGDLRVSALASSNNINSPGFSFDEVFDMMGGSARRIIVRGNSFGINGMQFGGTGGITKSETAGLNFTDKWRDRYEVSANYFYGGNDTRTRSLVERETFLPFGTYFTNTESTGKLVNDSHRANISFEVEFDTLTKLSIRPEIRINEGFSSRTRSSETFDGEMDLVNRSSTSDNEELYNKNFSNEISFIRRFGGRGAYIQASFENDNDLQETDNLFYSETFTYNGTSPEIENRNQKIGQDQESDEYRLQLNQRSVLHDDLFLDLAYDFNTTGSSNIREVFDFNKTTGEFDLYNEVLSNDFSIQSLQHIPNLGLNYEGEKLRAGFDIGLLSTSLESEDRIRNVSFDRKFDNLFLSSNIRYEVARGKSLYLHYNTRSDVPGVRQMQPVLDVTDPLNLVIGNPDLRPTYSHRVNLGYHNFDFGTRSGVSFYGGLTYSKDEVVPYTVTNDDLVSTTTYTNVDGGLSSYAGGTYNKRIKKDDHEFSYRLGTYLNYNRDIGFANEERYSSNRLGISPQVRLGYNYSELIEINPRYELNYSTTDYDILNNREEEYVNHTLALEATAYWPGNVVFGNDISYQYYGNVSPGFDPTSLLWNMSLGYQFLGKDATLKVKVYDLLNENISTRRSTGHNYVQDTEELILERYLMLSFTYKLTRFGGKDPNKDGRSIMF